jgi:hypothetical protein
MRAIWITFAGIVLILLSYGSACFYVRTQYQASYNAVKIGDTADFVVALFDSPPVYETPEEPFARYASAKCKSPCVERLWFENRLALDIEAWSISLGSDGRVVEKYHWVSP